jgi:hypothetical protein
MNLYLLAHETLVAQLQIIICQQKDHSLVAERFESLIYSFAIKLTILIVT